MPILLDEALTPQQLDALTLLFLGGEVHTVCEKMNIERQTLLRWKKKPEWQEEWNIRLNERIERGRHRNVLGGDIGQTRLERLASGVGDPMVDEHGRQMKWPDGRLRWESVPYAQQLGASVALCKLADLEPAEKKDINLKTTTPDIAALEAERAALAAEKAALLAQLQETE
jgi:hypothetical protein